MPCPSWPSGRPARWRRRSHDTLVHLQRPENPTAMWEIALPPGFYRVRIIFGDATYTNSVYRVAVEGQVLDVQAICSADKKYITLTLRPTNAQVRSWRRFGPALGSGQDNIDGTPIVD